MEQIRDFKGIWIPKEIWLDERLSSLDKVVLAEIQSLDNGDGCFASNEYLANFCCCTERSIITTLNNLEKLGYIQRGNFDGRRRVLHSRGEKFSQQVCKNFIAEVKKFHPTNNNIDNNINNNIKKNIIKKKNAFEPPTYEEVLAYATTRNRTDLAKTFYEYFETGNWVDSLGKPVVNWKQKFITWEKNNNKGKTNNGKQQPKRDGSMYEDL